MNFFSDLPLWPVNVTRSAKPLIGRSDVFPANGPFAGSAAYGDGRQSECRRDCQRDRELAHVHLVSSPRPAVRGPRKQDSPACANGSTTCARFTNPEPSLPAARIARPTTAASAPAPASAATSAGERTPPAASTREPGGGDRGDELEVGPGERAVAVDRGAEDALDAGLRGRARPRARRSGPSSAVQPAVRTMPSFTSSATTSRSPSASAHGAGSGKAAVPTTTRSAPASSRASRVRRASGCRPRPGARAGAIAAATARTSSGRARPARAPSRSTRWIRAAPAAAKRRGERDRVAGAARRRRRSRPGAGARRPRRARRRRVSPRSGASSHSDSTAPC